MFLHKNQHINFFGSKRAVFDIDKPSNVTSTPPPTPEETIRTRAQKQLAAIKEQVGRYVDAQKKAPSEHKLQRTDAAVKNGIQQMNSIADTASRQIDSLKTGKNNAPDAIIIHDITVEETLEASKKTLVELANTISQQYVDTILSENQQRLAKASDAIQQLEALSANANALIFAQQKLDSISSTNNEALKDKLKQEQTSCKQQAEALAKKTIDTASDEAEVQSKVIGAFLEETDFRNFNPQPLIEALKVLNTKSEHFIGLLQILKQFDLDKATLLENFKKIEEKRILVENALQFYHPTVAPNAVATVRGLEENYLKALDHFARLQEIKAPPYGPQMNQARLWILGAQKTLHEAQANYDKNLAKDFAAIKEDAIQAYTPISAPHLYADDIQTHANSQDIDADTFRAYAPKDILTDKAVQDAENSFAYLRTPNPSLGIEAIKKNAEQFAKALYHISRQYTYMGALRRKLQSEQASDPDKLAKIQQIDALIPRINKFKADFQKGLSAAPFEKEDKNSYNKNLNSLSWTEENFKAALKYLDALPKNNPAVINAKGWPTAAIARYTQARRVVGRQSRHIGVDLAQGAVK